MFLCRLPGGSYRQSICQTTESPPNTHSTTLCTCLWRRSVWSPLTASPRKRHPHRPYKTVWDVSESRSRPPEGWQRWHTFRNQRAGWKVRSFRINEYSLYWSHHQCGWNRVELRGRRLWWRVTQTLKDQQSYHLHIIVESTRGLNWRPHWLKASSLLPSRPQTSTALNSRNVCHNVWIFCIDNKR